jgi:hypothetical protein
MQLTDWATGRQHAVTPLSNMQRWRKIAGDGDTVVYENLSALPRAWLVEQVMSLSPGQVVAAIKTGRLPDGRDFDPRRVALLEEPADLKIQSTDDQAEVVVSNAQATIVELIAHCHQPAFLVLGDANYPGWQAEVDGQAARIYQTDYLLRGVALGPGEHRVRFVYQPRSLQWGRVISFTTLCVTGGWLVLRRTMRR